MCTGYQVLAQVPATVSVSAQDRYVAHLSVRTLITVFPVELDRLDYALVNLDTYPWRGLPDAKIGRTGDRVTITGAGGRELHFTAAAQAGPHLLLSRQR
jgi:hypothetical protein